MKKPISFKFDPELLEQLKKKAKDENRSLTNLIETVLWQWVRTH